MNEAKIAAQKAEFDAWLAAQPDSIPEVWLMRHGHDGDYASALFSWKAARALAAPQAEPGFVVVPVKPSSKQIAMMAGAILGQPEHTCDNRHEQWSKAVAQAERAYKSALFYAAHPAPKETT